MPSYRKLIVENQSNGGISNMYTNGDVIYATESGTLNIPEGIIGSHLYIINASGETVIVKVSPNDSLNDIVDGEDSIKTEIGKPLIRHYICPASNKWYSF